MRANILRVSNSRRATRSIALISSLISVFIASAPSFALNDAPQTFTLDGQLFEGSTGTGGTTTPLTDPNVNLVIQVLNPAKTCIIYEEQQTIDTYTSGGYFNVQVGSLTGSGKRTVIDPGLTMAQVFQNTSTVAAANAQGVTCPGGIYTPQPGDARFFRIVVTPSSTGVTDTLSPDMTLDSVPSALVAQSVQGLEKANILQVNSTGSIQLTQNNLQNLFTNPGYGNLQAILAGNLPTSSSGGTGLPVLAGSPTAPSTGTVWYNSSTNTIEYYNGTAAQSLGVSGSGISSLSVTSRFTTNGTAGGTLTGPGTIDLNASGVGAGTYSKVQVDTYGRVTAGSQVSGSDITSGTIAGTTAVNTSGGLTTTGAVSGASLTASGNVTAQNVSANGASLRTLVLNDNESTPKTATIQAPTTLTNSYALTLPAALPGTSGYVLSTDTSGNLSWIASATGSVTSVTATSPLASSGGATPAISIAKASGTQDGYLAQADFTTFNNKLGSTLASGNIFVGNSSNVATSAVLSGDASLSNAGVMTTTGLSGVPYAIASLATSQYLKYNGTNWVNSSIAVADVTGLATQLGNTINASQMPANCASNETLTFSSPTGSWACSNISITGSAFGPQAPTVVLAGPVSGANAAPLFRSLASTDLPAGGYDSRYFKTGGNSFGAAASIGTADSNNLNLVTGGSSRVTVDTSGRVGIGTQSPSAYLNVQAGSATIAPLQLTAGTNLTTPLSGAIEYDGTSLYYTDSAATRHTLSSSGGSASQSFTGDITMSGSGTGLAVTNAATVGSTLGVTGLTTLTGGFTSGAASSITSNTNSTSTATGALTVAGGVGAAGNIYSGGVVAVSGGAANLPSYTFSSDTASGLWQPSTGQVALSTAGLERLRVNATGQVGIGTNSPTALLNLKAGTATAGTSPLKFTSGSLLTTPEAGSIEYDGTNLYFTNAVPTRLTLATTTGGQTISGNETFSGDVAISGAGTGLAVTNAATVGTTLGVTGLTTLTGGFTSAGTAAVTNSTASTSTSTGAMTVAGGLGVAGTVNANILAAASGALDTPSHTFISDLNSGMWSPATGALAFSTNSTEKMRILSNGNVGIGTTSPQAALDIVTSGTNSAMLVPRDTTANRPTSPLTGMLRYNTINSAFEVYIGSSWLNLQTNNGGSTGVSVADNTLYAPSTATAQFPGGPNVNATNSSMTNSTSAQFVARVRNASGTYQYGYYGAVSIAGTGSPALVMGQTDSGGTTYLERMRIDSNGNVGIGTTSPTAKLNIAAGTASLAPLQLSSGTNLTTPLSGAIEYDGTSLYYTDSTATRHTLSSSGGTTTQSFTGDVTMSGSGTGLAVTNAATVGTTLGVTGLTTLTGGFTSAGTAAVTNSTASTSTTTGAETVAGGLGVAGTVNANILAAASGALATPSHTFISDLNSGMWSPATGALAFSTNSTEKMRILSNGNVGVGTASPAGILDVEGGTVAYLGVTTPITLQAQNGNSSTGGALNLKAGAGAPGGAVSATAGDGGAVGGAVNITAGGGISGTGTNNFGGAVNITAGRAFYTGATPGNIVLQGGIGTFGANGGNIILLPGTGTVAGNVGVGTTTPGYPLDVVGTVRAGTFISQNTSTSNTALTWSTGVTGSDTRFWDWFTSGPTLNLRALNDAYTASNAAMTFTRSGYTISSTTFPTGNVGIGTTSPTAKLNIAAGTTSLAPLQLTSGTNLTTPLSGAIEYDGTSLYYTDSTATRHTLSSSGGTTTQSFTGDVTMSGSGTGLAVTNAATVGTTLGVTGLTTLTGGFTSAGTAAVTNSTASTSTTTGAETVAGGLGVGGTVNANILAAASGALATPSHTFISDLNSGMWSPATGALAFSTNSTEKMRILSNGNVGMGTTSPGVPLDVVGAVRSSSGFSIGANQTLNMYGSGGELQLANGYGNGFISFFTNNGTSTTEKMRINGSGNVGIGSASPAYPLDVNGGARVTGNVYGNSIVFANGGFIGGSIAGSQATGGSLTVDSTTHPTKGNIFIAPSGGNVGVGTTSPTQALDIGTGVMRSGLLEFSGTPQAFASPAKFGNDTPTAFMYMDSTYNAFRIGTQGTGGYNYLDFDLPSGSGYQDIMQLATNYLAPAADNTISLGKSSARWSGLVIGTGNSTFAGNVGIGTTSPGYLLDVNGTAAIEGTALAIDPGNNTSSSINFSGNRGAIGFDVTTQNTFLYAGGAKGIVLDVNGAAASSPSLAISSAGNVGIGTSSAANKLDVSGSLAVGYAGTASGSSNSIVVNGKVGIGTSSPALKLDVTGSTIFRGPTVGGIDGELYYDTTSHAYLYYNANAAAWQSLAGGNVTYNGGTWGTSGSTVYYAAGNVGIGTSSATQPLTVTGTSYFNGNVGIGTTSPTALLHLLNGEMTVDDNANSAHGITFRRNNTGVGYISTTNGRFNLNAFSGYNVGITDSAGNGILVQNGGNVSIGTTSPTAKLNIAAGTATVAPLQLTSGTNLTTPLSGAIEYDGTNLYYTDSSATRRTLASSGGSGAQSFTNDVTLSGAGTGLAVTNAATVGTTLGVSGLTTLTGGFTSAGTAVVTNTTASTSVTTGAETVAGGLGVAGTVNANIHASASGAVATPSHTFISDLNSGMWSPSTGALAFSTNSLERMRMTSAGNIGIGTTAPLNALEVNGVDSTVYAPSSSSIGSPSSGSTASATVASTLTNRNLSNGSGAYFNLAAGNSGGAIQSAYIAAISNSSGYTPTLVIGSRSGSTAYQERMRIDTNGNVGIGSTSPAYKLDVAGAINASAITINGSSIGTSTSSYWNQTGSNLSYVAGSVGIGTASPASPLEVSGTSGSPGTGVLRVSTTNNAFNDQAYINFVSGRAGVGWDGARGALDLTVGSGKIFTFTINSSEKMRMDSSGNVGIGTTSPVAALDVHGHIANSGTAATVGACGGGTPAIVGNDARGVVTVGTGGITSCLVTFAAAYSSTPICVATWNGASPPTAIISGTAATGTYTVYFSSSVTSGSFSYHCMQ